MDKRINQIQEIINQLIAGDLNVNIEVPDNIDEIDKILLSLKTLADELLVFASNTQNQIQSLESRMNLEITEAKSQIISMLQKEVDKRQIESLIEKLKSNTFLN